VTVRVLQIGAGIRGRHWAELIKAYPDATHVGLVEPDPTNRDKARAIIGDGCPYLAGLEEALGSVQADAALVVTPDALHREHVAACLAAGLTVLVEKPLAPTLDDALAMLAKAREAGRQVIVAEQYRFWPAERTVRKLLDDGAVGRVDHATLVDRRNQPSGTEGPWVAGLDHPQLQDIAVHHFDSLRMWFGRPTSVFARAWNSPWSDYRGKCNTAALLGFGSVEVQYLGTMRSHRFAYSLFIEGERGAIWTNRKYVAQRKGGSRWLVPVRNVPVPKGDEAPYPRGGTTSLLNALRDAVRNGAAAETRAEDNIWTIAMLEAGRRSDRERREVRVDEVLPEERLGGDGG
jgi:predicted dehydrogenase